jgi:hypothetical protein
MTALLLSETLTRLFYVLQHLPLTSEVYHGMLENLPRSRNEAFLLLLSLNLAMHRQITSANASPDDCSVLFARPTIDYFMFCWI